MITTNADCHPLMRLMHKYDPKLPADQQDKRAVVAIERENWRTWLSGDPQQALALVQPPSLAMIDHAPADPGVIERLPL